MKGWNIWLGIRKGLCGFVLLLGLGDLWVGLRGGVIRFREPHGYYLAVVCNGGFFSLVISQWGGSH